MRKVIVALVVFVAVVLVMALPAFAHENGNHYGQHREAHTHTQPAKDQDLLLPAPAQNGVHGDFHSHD